MYLVPGRDVESAADLLTRLDGGIVFLAVPDPAIEPTAVRLAASRAPLGTAFVHLSGAYGLAPLAPIESAGYPVGAFHPLQSFTKERSPDAFANTLFGVCASTSELMERLERVAEELGGSARIVADAERALYHAAAVIASNYLNSLVLEAARVLSAIGWSREESLAALLPLIRGAVENLAAQGLPDALIGPIRRGDPDTVARHVVALEALTGASGERTRHVYRLLGEDALELASEAGLQPRTAAKIAAKLRATPSPRISVDGWPQTKDTS